MDDRYIVKVSLIKKETCMDYFAFPGRNCENLNFPIYLSNDIRTVEKSFGLKGIQDKNSVAYF